MKKTRRMLSILLTAAMMLSMMVSVNAETKSIDVNGDVYINDADFYVRSSDGAYKPRSRSFPGASGDTILGYLQPGLPMIADVNLNVKKPGFYKVVVDSTHKVASSSMATVGFEVNESRKIYFSASNSTYTTPTINGAKYPDNTFTIQNIAYNEMVYLGEGDNTLKVHWKNDVNNVANMAFDGVKLEYAGALPTIDGTDNTTLEFEDYTYGKWVKTSAGASGGDTKNHVVLYGLSGEQYITMKFNVAKTDYYSMTVDASTSNNGSPQLHLSDWHVTVNDEAEVSVGHPYQNTYTTVSGATYTATFLKSRSKLKNNFLLKEGENTITFRVSGRRSLEGNVYAEFDCLNLTATNSVPTVSETYATTIGNSSFNWSYPSSKNSDNAYDGTYTQLEGAATTITATKTFYVEKTKEYALNVYAAASVTNEWMSDLKFAIDEEEAVTFTSSNSTVEALTSSPSSGMFKTKNIKYNDKILLDEGLHTITFTIPQASSYGQKQKAAYFTFDCATLIPIQSLDGVDLEKSSYVCKVGDKIVPGLINSEGKKVPVEQFTSYKTKISDDVVAYTENNVEVIALNKGHAKFKIIALADGVEYEFEGELYVTDEQSIYITEAVLDTNIIKLNIASATDYVGGDKLIFAVFEMQDGCQTSLKNIYTRELPEIIADGDAEITQSISALGENEFVRIFVINSTNKNRAIYGKITLVLEEAE